MGNPNSMVNGMGLILKFEPVIFQNKHIQMGNTDPTYNLVEPMLHTQLIRQNLVCDREK
jgi:hypothetical protein